MASNKRKRNLDQSTRDSLSALEKALEMANVLPLQSHEFISSDFIEKTNMPERTARQFLQDQVKKGVLKMRKIRHNGKANNAYSDAKSK